MQHVVLIHRGLVGALLAGRKCAEARLSRVRAVPLGKVVPGDTLWFRQVGGGYVARACVRQVVTAQGLTPKGVQSLRQRHGRDVAAPPAFWSQRLEARYGTIVCFDDVLPTDSGPLVARKAGDRHSWFVIESTAAPSQPAVSYAA